MNVSVAKIPITYETITEMFCHFGEQLQCQDNMKLNEYFDESKDNTYINFKDWISLMMCYKKQLMRFHH